MKYRFLIPVLVLALLLGACGSREAPPDTTLAGTTAGTSLPQDTTQPAVETTVPVPEGPSVLDFLKIAAQPVGSTMYVWGGGWNEEDTGAGVEAVTIGVSPRWAQFAAEQDSSYDYKTTRYQIHDGLDCSGYVGWAVYNVLETQDGQTGYVGPATKMAFQFAELGLGEYTPAGEVTSWKAGDIMSMNGHVWIAVGMCNDGSVLFLHASPPGVIFSGTQLPDGTDSQAVALAEKIMAERYPDWYARFPDCARPYTYLTTASAMRWNRETLADPEGICEMSAEAAARAIFE